MEYSSEVIKAVQLVQNAWYDESGMQDIMRQDAAIYASIAQAKAMERVAVALENLGLCIDVKNDAFVVRQVEP